jgi:regulator of replication initiation timing
MGGAEPGEVNFEDLSKVLQIENEKLREALRRLSDISMKDKETIKQLAPTMQQLEEELRDLKAFKRQALQQ